MREDIQSILYSQETLAQKVRQMGQKISQDYAGKNPLLVSVDVYKRQSIKSPARRWEL